MAFSVPPFATRCLDAAGPVWAASFSHPFVRALADGSLDADRFRFYQIQDARYLEAFADTCSLISTRCALSSDKLWFIEAARLAIVVERQLHEGYGRKLGYSPDDIASAVLTPNNAAYQNHMIATAQRGSLVESVAAMTPCPWLYIALGAQLQQELGDVPNDHPYADWLRMYADPGFDLYMDELLSRLQRFADHANPQDAERAIGAFVLSVRYEWMFWQQAWERQEWLPSSAT